MSSFTTTGPAWNTPPPLGYDTAGQSNGQPEGGTAVARRTGIIGEFILFMRERKAYWMAPIIVGLLLLALLVVLGNTAGAPFIYTLF
jgi:hypothetical protein